MALVDYSGVYTLRDIVDAHSVAAILPRDDFRMQLKKADSDDTRYSFSLKIGNSMSTSLSIAEDHSVETGFLISSRMMPSPELYKIESLVNDVLPKVNQIHLENQLLTMEGPNGKLVAVLN